MTQTAGESTDLAKPTGEVQELPPRLALNSRKLMEHVDIVRAHRGISGRDAAIEMGVPHDSLTRMRREGMVPGGEVIAAVLAWLRVPPNAYLEPRAERPARKSA